MEAHAVDLAMELARRGSDVRLVLPTSPEYDALAHAASQGKVRLWRLDTISWQGRRAQAKAHAALARQLMRWRPDVVHVHTGTTTGGLTVVLLARLVTSAVVVLTEHDVPSPVPSLHQIVTRAMIDWSVDALIAVSRRNARLRTRRLPVRTPHFVSVLNGVPIPEVDPAAAADDSLEVRRELGIPQEAVVVGCLVRLAEGKGLTTLLRAFAMLPPSPETRLLLVGDGPLRPELERLAVELAIDGRVVFAGYRPQPTPYLNAMDIFALAVPAGSMSIALLEAMARGIPAVITFGGPEEPVVHGLTGLEAPPNDPEGLAVAIARLVEDRPMAAAMGAAAAAHVRRHFSVQRLGDDLLEVYGIRTTRVLADRLRADSQPARIDGLAGQAPARAEAWSGLAD